MNYFFSISCKTENRSLEIESPDWAELSKMLTVPLYRLREVPKESI